MYWDDQSIFIEHRFVGKDEFIHAIAICKQRLINCSSEEIMDIMLSETPTHADSTEKLENGDLVRYKPDMPLEVSLMVDLFTQITLLKFHLLPASTDIEMERI